MDKDRIEVAILALRARKREIERILARRNRDLHNEMKQITTQIAELQKSLDALSQEGESETVLDTASQNITENSNRATESRTNSTNVISQKPKRDINDILKELGI